MYYNYPLTFTFILTESCQLACKYCYLVGKNSNNRLDFAIAKKSINYLVDNHELFRNKNVIFEFIGGEPFLEIDLMDRICDYIKETLYIHQHPWFSNYTFGVSTNGLMYSDKRVQNFIEKNHNCLSIVISIDGTKEKHDLNRVYPNGKGSYNDVVKQIPLWLKDFPKASTKVTIASSDIPFIAESIIHLFDLGIHTVNSNVVHEDVWQDGDDVKFEKQLIELADQMIEKKYYQSNTCSFFADFIGKPRNDNQNWCGSGKSMLAVDSKGYFYPCLRFSKFSLENKEPRIIGNVENGLNLNKLRPFLALNRISQSKPECVNCEVASGCAWCTGANYDCAQTDTIYERTTYICKMHKARVRANNYYQSRIKEIEAVTNA
jgi:uncharacterized protein